MLLAKILRSSLSALLQPLVFCQKKKRSSFPCLRCVSLLHAFLAKFFAGLSLWRIWNIKLLVNTFLFLSQKRNVRSKITLSVAETLNTIKVSWELFFCQNCSLSNLLLQRSSSAKDWIHFIAEKMLQRKVLPIWWILVPTIFLLSLHQVCLHVLLLVKGLKFKSSFSPLQCSKMFSLSHWLATKKGRSSKEQQQLSILLPVSRYLLRSLASATLSFLPHTPSTTSHFFFFFFWLPPSKLRAKDSNHIGWPCFTFRAFSTQEQLFYQACFGFLWFSLVELQQSLPRALRLCPTFDPFTRAELFRWWTYQRW